MRVHFLKIMAAAFYFSVVFSMLPQKAIAAHVVGADDGKVPQDKEQILQAINDIIEHGDLSDEKYYENKLGVSMKSGGIVDAYAWGQMCTFLRTSNKAEYFNNISMPWYFDGNAEFRNDCGEFPYRKEFLRDGRVKVAINIFFKRSSICLTHQDFSESFSVINHRHDPLERIGRYIFDGKNSMELFLLHNPKDNCIVELNIFQNINEGGA